MIILVVEDNTQSLYLLQRFFSGCGHTVRSATNGREALVSCREQGAPDVIVSDALMPMMDGFELCYALRQDPALCNVPFILYTATYTADSDERFALSVGVDRFVLKPTEPERLLEIVKEVVTKTAEAPERRPQNVEPRPEFLEEYAHRVSLKLEAKVAELEQTNQLLGSSEKAVRELNEKLLTGIQRLQAEISERRRAETLLRLALSVGRMGSWEAETKEGQVFFSTEAQKLIGLEGESAAVFEAFLASAEGAQRDALRTFFTRTEGLSELHIDYAHPRAGRRHLHLRKQQLPAESPAPAKPLQVGTIQDVTDVRDAEQRRRQLEHQLFRAQKMEALGNLAGGVAHDFNNILTTIFGHAEIIAEELEGRPGMEEASRSLAEITNAAQRSRETIRQILTFSRKQTVDRVPVRLSEVVAEGLRLVRAVLNNRITLKTDLRTRRRVLANETQIHQVLLNLCTNACYAMRDRGGALEVSLFCPDDEGGVAGASPAKAAARVLLRVADCGVGIPPEHLEHIFEPFYTTKPNGEGTGLGLSVVHGIVESHEAAIQVESTPGQGTVFTITFPSLDEAPEPSRAKAGQAGPQGQGEHILVVDDEPSAAHICAKHLRELGYQAITATDSNEARTLFLREPAAFDAAIIDTLMPQLTGSDLARALRTARPGFPIVLVAGFGAQSDLGKQGCDYADQILTKPYSMATLAETLAHVLH